MSTDLTSKLPIKEHIRNIRKILAMVSSLDKTYFPTSCIVHIINAAIPYIELILSAYILDSLIVGKAFKEIFAVAAITTIFIFIIRFIASTVWNKLEVRARTAYQLYECITEEKMLQMDYAKIDSPVVKELKDRIERDLNWGSGLYSVFWQFNGILYGCFNLIFAIIIGIPVIYHVAVSYEFTIYVAIILIVIVLIVTKKIFVHYKKYVAQGMFRNYETDEERIERATVTWQYVYGDGFNYKNGKDIRIYGAYDILKHWTIGQNKSKANVKEINDMTKSNIKSEFYGNLSVGILESGSYLIVGILALKGALSVGNVIRMSGCLRSIFNEIQALSGNISDFALTARKHASTLELLEVSDEMYKGKLPLEKRSDNQYLIEFKNVTFKYPSSQHYALKNFSMTLKIGEKLAIVGMNGSGKTTMIKLLCRLYDPDEGEILLNGVDIRKFKQDEYSKLFSVVFQDYQLFSFKLAENVAVLRKYDSKKVKECLIDAGFEERLGELSDGMESYLYKEYDDNGIEISGGEAQKIAIARAVYKDAPFILLDEPTAALDPLSEYEIYTGFDKIIGEKTAIYISHRLSSCKFCEKIAVFHEGELIQEGSHDELVKDIKGKYYEMWNAQAQYYS